MLYPSIRTNTFFLKLRCDELDAEVEALMKSLATSKQMVTHLQARVNDLEADLSAAHIVAMESEVRA